MEGSPRSIDEIGAEIAAASDATEAYHALPEDEQLAVRREVLPTHEQLQATTEQLAEEDPELWGTK